MKVFRSELLSGKSAIKDDNQKEATVERGLVLYARYSTVYIYGRYTVKKVNNFPGQGEFG